jgi:hypothetical protein
MVQADTQARGIIACRSSDAAHTDQEQARRNERNPRQYEANEPATGGREAVSQLNAAAEPALVLRGR